MGRLASLDAMRGFVMVMLVASGFGVAKFAALPPDAPVWERADYDSWQQIGFHFSHPAWASNFRPSWMPDHPLLHIGVSFWDMIQPGFMFMVGVAMPFSYARRRGRGDTNRSLAGHAFRRAVILVLLGVFLQSMRGPRTHWLFTNVLSQIGLGYFFVFLLLGMRPRGQLVIGAGVLILSWFAFWVAPPPEDYDFAAVRASAEKGEVYEGRFRSWSKNGNFGHRLDRVLLNAFRTPTEDGKLKPLPSNAGFVQRLRRIFFSEPTEFKFQSGGYQTLNFLPSIFTMLLGVLCGQLLHKPTISSRKKLGLLVAGGFICLLAAMPMGIWICPIVKRIWTPSWALFSGAYVIWTLAAFYLIFDMLPFKKVAFPLAVVGANSLAAYLMGQMMRPFVISRVVERHFYGALEAIGGSQWLADDQWGRLVAPTLAFCVFWLILFWLYRQKWFLRI